MADFPARKRLGCGSNNYQDPRQSPAGCAPNHAVAHITENNPGDESLWRALSSVRPARRDRYLMEDGPPGARKSPEKPQNSIFRRPPSQVEDFREKNSSQLSEDSLRRRKGVRGARGARGLIALPCEHWKREESKILIELLRR